VLDFRRILFALVAKRIEGRFDSHACGYRQAKEDVAIQCNNSYQSEHMDISLSDLEQAVAIRRQIDSLQQLRKKRSVA
jgi:hypothetical protein